MLQEKTLVGDSNCLSRKRHVDRNHYTYDFENLRDIHNYGVVRSCLENQGSRHEWQARLPSPRAGGQGSY